MWTQGPMFRGWKDDVKGVITRRGGIWAEMQNLSWTLTYAVQYYLQEKVRQEFYDLKWWRLKDFN